MAVGNGTILGGTGSIAPAGANGVAFTSGSTYAVTMNGITAGTQYDQINVLGTGTVTGTMILTGSVGYTPAHGAVFTIIKTAAAAGIPAATVFENSQGSILSNGNTIIFGGFNFTIGGIGTGSAAVTLTYVNAPTTTAVTSSATSVVFGQPLTFTATVTSAAYGSNLTAPGTVTFFDGSTSLGTASLGGSSGNATATLTPTLPVTGSTHAISAVYNGDGVNFAASSPSNTVTQTVNQASTTTTVTSSTGSGTSVFGQSVTFTATVYAQFSGTPSGGMVTFQDNGTSIGTGTLSSGKYTYTTSFNSAGSVATHPITAIYDAVSDANFLASPTSAALNQTVNRASTTTTVTNATNPSVFGQSVTFTATVSAASPGSGTPSGGTVTFKDNGTSIGTGVVSSGTATYTTSDLQLPAGTDPITAYYDGVGDANFTVSAAPATFSQTVAKATTSTTLAPPEGASTFGQPVTFTATVTNTSVGSYAAPVGAVTFSDGGTSIGQAPLSATSSTSATATFTTSSLSFPNSPHTLTAVYNGDGANFAASAVSNSVTQTVSQATTTTTLAVSPNPSAFGQSVTFTATVTPQIPDTFDNGGTVTFSDGSTSLGTASLSGGQATLNAPASVFDTVATHMITAGYSGDTNFTGSGSDSVLQTVNAACTTTTVTSSTSGTSAFGQFVTFTATVTAGSGTFDNGGTVTFSDGSTSLGTTSLSNGQTTYAAPSSVFDMVATHVITASYSGDTNFSGSPGSMLQTISQATTSTTVSSTPNPVIDGNPVTFTAIINFTAGLGSLAGTVTFEDGGTSIGIGNITGSTATLSISTIEPAGQTHSITAVYVPDDSTNISGNTSVAFTQTVQQTTSTTVTASPAGPSIFGDSVTFTATVTVTSISNNKWAPTGTVTFLDGGVSLATASLSGSSTVTATYSTSSLGAATHVITAAYAGDTFDAADTPEQRIALLQTVSQTSTTTTVTSSTSGTSAFGQSVTFTATVTAGSGTFDNGGTVTFSDGSTSLGTTSLSNGQAIYAAPASVFDMVATHVITASYSGDTNFSGSSPGSMLQTISQARTSTTVSSTPNPVVDGNPVTFTASVSFTAGYGVLAGTVTFEDGGTSIGTGNVTGSTATLSTSTLEPAGQTHSITAVYVPDDTTNISGNTSGAFTQTVQQTTSTTVTASSAEPSIFGASVTFTATVTATGSQHGTWAPTGTVTFLDGGTSLGTASLSGSSTATATYTTSSLGAATHTITAAYAGDALDDANASAQRVPLLQTVTQATTTTTLAVSPNPSVFDQSVTCTATVSPQFSGTPSGGTVTFLDGATSLGAAPLAAGGFATLTTSFNLVATHPLTAIYDAAGDVNFTGSTSAAFDQTVNKASTTTTVTNATNPSVFGQSVTFTATVSPQFTGIPSGGTVTFLDNGSSIGTGVVTSGTATYSTSAMQLPTGTDHITAYYDGVGDTNFTGSLTSATFNQTVNKASTTTTLSAFSPNVFGHDQVTFTVTVSANSPGSGTPTGTVTFLEGATSLGTGGLSGGNASITLGPSILAAGSHTITAVYSSNSNFNASTSTASSQTVQTVDPAVLVWTGSSSNLWSDSGNWQGLSGEPSETLQTGDELRFGDPAAQHLSDNTDDMSSLTSVKSIEFTTGGYTITGSGVTSITITANGTDASSGNAIVASNTSGTNTISLNVTFSTTAPTISQSASGSLVVSGNVTTSGNLTVTVAGAGNTTLSGVVSGGGR